LDALSIILPTKRKYIIWKLNLTNVGNSHYGARGKPARWEIIK
jgi:hypothetical protein